MIKNLNEYVVKIIIAMEKLRRVRERQTGAL